MKKIVSLLRACMTSDMNIFKVKQKKDNNKKSMLPLFLAFCFMFAIWSNINMIFEKLAPMHLQVLVISLVVFLSSIMIIVEGVYKAGPLLFNCKDDQLLLSLPIKKSTVLFVRIFKFYVFELVFNALFMIPLVVSYLRWAENLNWTFFLTSTIMILLLPVIPVALSCVIGVITSGISSRSRFKNLTQIVTSLFIVFVFLFISMNMERLYEYVAKHATSINDFIMKLYYPAGVYAKLVTEFNIVDLLIFILVNILVFGITLFVLSKFYFKINSRLKSVSSSRKIKVDNLVIRSRTPMSALVRKELTTFFKTPVFIVNAGFSLVMFVAAVIGLCIKYDQVIVLFKDILPEAIMENYLSIFVFILISFAAFMTSITNSVISLEGRNINILKSLPIKVKDILMSKVFSSLFITTPPIVVGDIILFIRFKLGFVEMLLLLLMSVLIPLVSHFVGIIVNLKYPKLEWENSAEVVKQSMSSFLAVLIGIILLIFSVFVVTKLIEFLSVVQILLIFFGVYLVIDMILYIYLVKVSVKDFNQLSV